MKEALRQMGYGTWITIGSPIITEMISHLPFDWLLFDMEHGYLTENSILENLQAVRGSKIKQIVRIPAINKSLIGRVLDYGANGIMVPHVTSAKQVKDCISAMRYPPNGERGYSGQVRSFGFGLTTPKDLQSGSIPYLLVQIEDYEGVLNAHEIAQIDGLDVLFVGPSDLRLNLSSEHKTSLEFNSALKIVVDAALKSNKQAGILAKNIEDIPKYLQLGFTCLAIESDLGILRKGYQVLIDKLDTRDSNRL